MPLLDHFRPPLLNTTSWEGFYGGWPMAIVQELNKVLPDEFTAEPRVHMGPYFEIDVCAFEPDASYPAAGGDSENSGGIATATYSPPKATLATDVDFGDQYAYEVLIFDESRGRQLVAAIELVSPANKDRPKNREVFVTKCAAMLQNNICVSIVDLVSIRQFNLYCDLLQRIERTDPVFVPEPPSIYAVTCRTCKVNERPRFESWAFPLQIGQRLPTLPIWLTDILPIPLNLDASYDATCKALRIRS